jgi:hypothetical protein
MQPLLSVGSLVFVDVPSGSPTWLVNLSVREFSQPFKPLSYESRWGISQTYRRACLFQGSLHVTLVLREWPWTKENHFLFMSCHAATRIHFWVMSVVRGHCRGRLGIVIWCVGTFGTWTRGFWGTSVLMSEGIRIWPACAYSCHYGCFLGHQTQCLWRLPSNGRGHEKTSRSRGHAKEKRPANLIFVFVSSPYLFTDFSFWISTGEGG